MLQITRKTTHLTELGSAPGRAAAIGAAVRYSVPIEESTMSDAPNRETASLIMIQFLAWVADRPRSYADAMEAWRSSCPRLSVWEDAIIEGLVQLENGGSRAVSLTRRGRAMLEKARAPAR